MMMTFFQSRRISFYGRILFFFLMCAILHRLGFMLYFYQSANQSNHYLNLSSLFHSFWVGFRFDLRLSVIISLPFLLLTSLSFFDPQTWKGAKLWWKFYFLFIFVVQQFFYIFDYGHYSYLNSRLNASLLNLVDMSNWQISAKMIWETYPILWILFTLAFFIYLTSLILNHFIFAVYLKPSESLSRTWAKAFMSWFIVLFLSAWAIWGTGTFFPLRWSDAYFSSNNYLSNSALNPIFSFIESFKFKGQMMTKELVAPYYDLVADHLGVPENERDAKNLNFKRQVMAKENPRLPGHPNVVIILAESMASFMTKEYGNPLGDRSTPFLSELISQSLYFSNFMVPVQATARSVFGLVTGIPDVSGVKTSSGNPMLVSQHTLINDLKGYKKFYFLGGNASWGNIRGLFSHNIDGIEILEEDRFKERREDVWGISDYKLAEIANEEFKKTKEPFFALFQTSGFHRPYTIPDELGDFNALEEKDISLKELNQYGFDDLAQLNSLRFQDYSLRHFIELAKKSPYFDNTLFIFLGDHGLPMKASTHVPPSDTRIDLPCFHVPLVFYAPKFFSREVNTKLVSQVDLMPTILSLLGMPYTNTTLGRDIFDETFDTKRRNFMYYWYYNPPRFVLLDSKGYYAGGLEDDATVSHIYWEENMEERRKHPSSPPDKTKEEITRDAKLARGLFLTSKYLLSHNPNLSL